MGKWADLARQIEEEDPRANSVISADSPPNGTNGTIGTRHLSIPPSEPQARALLREWHAGLVGLDFDQAPDGFDLSYWRRLITDAEWIYEHFASQLVREGWSTLDLFGVWPGRPGWGGLSDRLQTARNLKLDGRGAAYWTNFGVRSRMVRGASTRGSALLP